MAELPEPEPTTCSIASRFTPAAWASVMPSASAAAFTAASVLLISLTIEPCAVRAGVDHELAHRLEQRPGALEVRLRRRRP